MKIVFPLLAMLLWGMCAYGDVDLNRRSPVAGHGNNFLSRYKQRAADWIYKKTTVMYAGFSKGKKSGIDIYQWNENKKIFQLRDSITTIALPVCLLRTAASRLISVDEPTTGEQEIEMIALGKAAKKSRLLKSNLVKHGLSRKATLDSSSKYLIAANNEGGEVLTYKLDETGLINKVDTATYDPKDEASVTVFVAFHPKAKDVLAVVNYGLDKITFLRFNSVGTESLTKLNVEAAIPANSTGPVELVFSPDGMYMYVACDTHLVHTYKIAVDVYKNDVISVEEKGTIKTTEGTVKDNYYVKIVIHPVLKFAFALDKMAYTVALYKIDPVTGQLLANDFEKTEGTYPEDLAIAPDGTMLLVADTKSGIAVYKIMLDGKLKKMYTVKDTTASSVLLYTKRNGIFETVVNWFCSFFY